MTTIPWATINKLEEDQHQDDLKEEYHLGMSNEDLIDWLKEMAANMDSEGWDMDAGNLREAARRIAS